MNMTSFLVVIWTESNVGDITFYLNYDINALVSTLQNDNLLLVQYNSFVRFVIEYEGMLTLPVFVFSIIVFQE
jgi:hypothetical protein